MKLFLYKTLIILLSIIVIYQFTIGASYRKINKSIENLKSKETVEKIKNKVRSEIQNGINSDRILSQKDADLLKKFIDKIVLELKY